MKNHTFTPARIALAVAAGLSAHTAFAQVPSPSKVKPNVKGLETTPSLDPSNTGAAFFENGRGAFRDPMLPVEIVDTAESKNTVNTPAPTESAEVVVGKEEKTLGAPELEKAAKNDKTEEAGAVRKEVVEAIAESKKTDLPVKTASKKVKHRKPSVVAAKEYKPRSSISPVTDIPDLPQFQRAEAVAVEEPPEDVPVVDLYAAQPGTPVVVTEVVRVDSIDLGVPTYAESETKALPVIPKTERVEVATVAEVEAQERTTPPREPNFFERLFGLGTTEKEQVVAQSVANPVALQGTDLSPMASEKAPVITEAKGADDWTPLAVRAPAHVPTGPSSVSLDPRDARIAALQAELAALQSTPMPVSHVEPPDVLKPALYPDVPAIDPKAAIQIPGPAPAPKAIKPTPKAPRTMISANKPVAPVDTPQTVAIDAPRSITPAPEVMVVEKKQHRVAQPKWPGLAEAGDFITFLEGSSHVSLETEAQLRTMVGMFRAHGIRKIVLQGTALRDEDSEGLESSEFAMQRARNLKSALQKAGFKGVIALDDPKRARPGTTPRVGLVALR